MNQAKDGARKSGAMRFGPVGIGAVIVAIVAVTIAVVGWHASRTSPNVARRLNSALPVEVAETGEFGLVEILGATGEVRPNSVVNLTAGLSMLVESVEADVGDTVSPGETLVRFDPELSRTLTEAARTRVEQATAELSRAEERLARVQRIYEDGYSDMALKTAGSTMEHAKGELVRAEENLKRVESIHKQGLMAITDLEQAQAAVQAARVRHDEAEENLLRVQADPQGDLEQAQAAVHSAVLARSRAQEEFVRAGRGLDVVSPVPGVIMERLVNPGETPNKGVTLLTVGQIDSVLVEAKVSEERVGDINLGMPATVTLSAFPNDTFTGDVVRIRPESDPLTQTFLVYVKLDNPDLKLKPGMSSFVRIEEPHDGLAVPSIALIKPTGVRDSAVFVVDKGSRARMRKVRVGAIGQGMTQIIDGLAAGDRVVVVGQYHLKDGDLVRIGDQI